MVVSMKKIVLTSSAITLALFSSAAFALAKNGNSSTAFHASGPGGLTIEGTTTELSVREDGDQIRVTVPLGNLDTGISLRDKHMREKYLEVSKFPNAELAVPKAAIKMPTSGSWTGDVNATVTIHGVSKPVAVHATVNGKGSKFEVNGSFRVNMNDFGVTVPSYLGVTVKPDVGVDSRFVVDGP